VKITAKYEDQVSPYQDIVERNSHGTLGLYQECLSDMTRGFIHTARHMEVWVNEITQYVWVPLPAPVLPCSEFRFSLLTKEDL